MNQMQQQELMLRFSHCKFKHNGNTYAEADCAGAAQIILRDFAGVLLPDDRTTWSELFDFLPWPLPLQDFDVLMLRYHNQFDFVDHIGVHIGNDYIVHFGKHTAGMICNRIDRFEGKIINVARYKK